MGNETRNGNEEMSLTGQCHYCFISIDNSDVTYYQCYLQYP